MTSNQIFVLCLILLGCGLSFVPQTSKEIPLLIIGGALTHLQKGENNENRNTDTIE